MSSSYHTKNNRTSKRGAFINGVWHCDCEPRLPADKFQTKNGGKNHGRWFYTCQQPQHKRCPFFLWEDGAKLREEGAVLSNSRTEPGATNSAQAHPQTPTRTAPEPQTPRKKTVQQTLLQLPVTPQSRPRLIARPSAKARVKTEEEEEEEGHSSATKAPPASLGQDTDEFDWSSGNDDDMASALDTFETPRKPSESPFKAAMPTPTQTPTKRTYSAMKEEPNDGADDNADDDDVFTTPTRHLLSPARTESLAAQALSLLGPHRHTLPAATISALTELLAAYELRTAGITRGRDLTRVALQHKEAKVAQLQSSVQSLEHERAVLRNAISLLKSDLAAHHAKSRRSSRSTRSTVDKA